MPHPVILHSTIQTAMFESRDSQRPDSDGEEVQITIQSHAANDVTTYENLTINIGGKPFTYKELDTVLSQARRFARAVNAFNK